MRGFLSRLRFRTIRRAERISSCRRHPFEGDRSQRTAGSILPITIFYLFLSQMMLFGIIRVYENQLYLYRLTENHYKAQTLLAYTDYWLKNNNEASTPESRIVPAVLSFEEGVVHCIADATGKVTATVTLQNDYSETVVLEFLSP